MNIAAVPTLPTLPSAHELATLLAGAELTDASENEKRLANAVRALSVRLAALERNGPSMIVAEDRNGVPLLGNMREALEHAQDAAEAGDEARAALQETELAAARWNALIGCGRLRLIGWANERGADGQQHVRHLGLEAWLEYPGAPTQAEAIDKLTDFADTMIARGHLLLPEAG